MFENYGNIIDAATELTETLTNVESALKGMRHGCERWNTDIQLDKRPAVQILWAAHKLSTEKLRALRGMRVIKEGADYNV